MGQSDTGNVFFWGGGVEPSGFGVAKQSGHFLSHITEKPNVFGRIITVSYSAGRTVTVSKLGVD